MHNPRFRGGDNEIPVKWDQDIRIIEVRPSAVCRTNSTPRSHINGNRPNDETALTEAPVDLASQYRRYDYRQMTVTLQLNSSHLKKPDRCTPRWDKTVHAIELVKRSEAPSPSPSTLPTRLKKCTIAGPTWTKSGGDRRHYSPSISGKPINRAGIHTGRSGKTRGERPPIRNDQQALRAVSGHDTALTYLSLNAALKTQKDSIPIRILTTDQVEAEEPTVHNGQHKLRRPILSLTAIHDDPVTTAFLAFAISPQG